MQEYNYAKTSIRNVPKINRNKKYLNYLWFNIDSILIRILHIML